jgi:hypothetical protein
MRRLLTFLGVLSITLLGALSIQLLWNSGQNPPSIQAQVSLPLGPYANTGFLNSVGGTTGAFTVPAFNMVGITSGALTAAATYTTDTATNLCALFPFVQTLTPGSANYAWDWYVRQTGGAFTITVAGGTGVTLVGTGTVAQAAVRHFKIQLTNCTAGAASANLYSLETATF